MSEVVDELQEQLLAHERELDTRECTIVVCEDGLMAFERTLVKACMECDAERAQVEAVQQDFLARTCTFSSNSKHSINFNWMLVERQILLSLQVMDLEVRVVKLV
jgi:hypothetical protein